MRIKFSQLDWFCAFVYFFGLSVCMFQKAKDLDEFRDDFIEDSKKKKGFRTIDCEQFKNYKVGEGYQVPLDIFNTMILSTDCEERLIGNHLKSA